MDQTTKLTYQLSQVRNELNNIRKTLYSERAQHKNDVKRLEELISSFTIAKNSNLENDPMKDKNYSEIIESKYSENNLDSPENQLYHMKPIGYMRSLHHQKNGTPRQGCISNFSRGKLQIEKDIYNNPSHALEGLNKYSHIWVFYIFHENTSDGSHAKVSPPRLDGLKVGIFSTRSPYRPNPIGMTLTKLEGIEGDSLLLSGIDILDGTPVIDIKPYIPQYDSPFAAKSFLAEESSPSRDLSSETLNDSNKIGNENEVLASKSPEELVALDLNRVEGLRLEDHESATENSLGGDCEELITVPRWINSPSSSGLTVIFNPIAEHQINAFSCGADDPSFRLEYLKSSEELKTAISSILSEDPRSTYRRHKCSDRLYFFMVDSAHITTCFFGDIVEVLRVCPPDKDNPYYRLL